MDVQKTIVQQFDLLPTDDLKSQYFIACTAAMDSATKLELMKMGWEGKDERDFLELYSAMHKEKHQAAFYVEPPKVYDGNKAHIAIAGKKIEPSEAAIEVAKAPKTKKKAKS